MAKKNQSNPTTTEVVEVKTANVRRFDPAQAAEVADMLAIDLGAAIEDRVDQAVAHVNRSQRHMLAAGILLASIKAECEHGEFTALIEARGFEERAARTAMQYASFVLSRPAGERQSLLNLPHTKVMRIASADPEVVEALLADGVENIDALSVRALQQRVRELEAATTDLAVQRDTAEAEAAGLRKQVKRGLPDRTDGVPLVVADLRAEIMALGKRGSLALEGFQGLSTDLMALVGTDHAHEWADATARLAAAQLSSLAVQLNGLLRYFATALPGEDLTPTPRSYLTRDEVLQAAQLFAELTQIDSYEQALREWERDQAKPKGKGRPKAKPVKPEAAEEAA